MGRNLAQPPQVTIQRERGERRGLSPWQVAFIATTCILITAGEYIFAYQDVAWGIIVSLGLAIGIYFILSVIRPDPRIADCGEALALIPLYILFTSSLPWFFINQQYLLPAVYSCILGLCLWHVYQKNLNLKEIFGFSKGKLLKYSLMGIAIGTPTGAVEYLILQPAPAFPTFEVNYLFRDMVSYLSKIGFQAE